MSKTENNDLNLDETIHVIVNKKMKQQLVVCSKIEKTKQNKILRRIIQIEIDRIFKIHNVKW